MPALQRKSPIGVIVSNSVTLNFGSPPFFVSLWSRSVQGAAMPKTSVAKNSQAQTGERNIYCTLGFFDARVDSESKAEAVK